MTIKINDITLAKLDVLLMPNGEIICLGKTIGFVDEEYSKNLSDFRSGITGEKIEVEKS